MMNDDDNTPMMEEEPQGSTDEAIATMDATKFAAYMGPSNPAMTSDGVPLTDVSSSSSSSTRLDNKTGTSSNKTCLACIRDSWSRLTMYIQRCITAFVVMLSVTAARNPKITISSITVLSFALVGIGFFTNFNLQVDYEKVYAPFNSLPLQNKEWINHESGFPKSPRPLTLIFHNDGDNVLGMDQIGRVFQALDTVRNAPDYKKICSASKYLNEYGEPDCKIYGATRFWNHDVTLFLQNVHSDQDAIEALSAATFPGGTPVYTDMVFGFAVRDNSNTTALVPADAQEANVNHNGALLTSAQSFFMRIDIPETEGVEDFERSLIPRLQKLRDQWVQHESKLQFSFFTMVAYDVEFTRAINQDLPLVPIMVLIMSAFTCIVFAEKDRVQSRSLLGIGCVMTVGMSLMTGYGIMFIAGVPFTSMTQILPFVVLGIGLDDTFIVTGAYFRTDPKKDTEDRIEETMLEVGTSISLTTITTITAFMLGCMSSIPAIQWVCLYAFPTIFITLVYQVTYFVALLVLDERRVQANRKDICICYEGPSPDDDDNVDGHDLDLEELGSDCENQRVKNEQGIPQTVTPEPPSNFANRFMKWYSTQLMRPWIKVLVVLVFVAYFAFCGYRTTMLTQEFKTQDFVPGDSFIAEFLAAIQKYSNQVMGIHVYFRHVNQSDPEVQQEMRDYMHDLMKLPAVDGTQPPFCWVMDFQKIQDDPEYEIMQHMEFKTALAFALTNPSVREAYGDDIVLDADGEIVASRCWLNPAKLDLDVVQQQVDLLAQQRAVSVAQPINQGRELDDMSFFTYDSLYFIWEFYTAAVNELTLTAITGVLAVCLVGFVLIRHWTAICFVAPLISMLYIDLLGTLQYAGLHINVVTYVCLVISIGLLVDFLMHILLRYYESSGATREAKVKDTLETMGASIMLGGLSTFLGVIPLAFSTSAVLRTVFTAFLAMVTLGVLHGLVLLPVVLSWLGPTVCISHGVAAADSNEGVDPTDEMYESPTKSVQELCHLHTAETDESLPSPTSTSKTGLGSNSVTEETSQEETSTSNNSATTGDASLAEDESVTTHESDELQAKQPLNLSNATTETIQTESYSFENENDNEAETPCTSEPQNVVADFDPFVNAQKANCEQLPTVDAMSDFDPVLQAKTANCEQQPRSQIEPGDAVTDADQSVNATQDAQCEQQAQPPIEPVIDDLTSADPSIDHEKPQSEPEPLPEDGASDFITDFDPFAISENDARSSLPQPEPQSIDLDDSSLHSR